MDKITEQDLANRGVKGLPDVPGLTTEEMQRKLEEIAREILIPKVNELVEGLNNANSNLIKYENKFYNVTIPANSTSVFNVGGFNGKGTTIACIVNTEYDLIQANGHMDSGNTFMRVTATNIHTDEQTINVSAIRLYI